MHYIKRNEITGNLCKYKLILYFEEFQDPETEKGARLIRWAYKKATPEEEIDYLLRFMFSVVIKGKFPLKGKTYNQDGKLHKGLNKLKKAVIYNVLDEEPIVNFDHWMYQQFIGNMFNKLAVNPSKNQYKQLDIEYQRDYRDFYRHFGFHYVEIGTSRVYGWHSDYILKNRRPAAV